MYWDYLSGRDADFSINYGFIGGEGGGKAKGESSASDINIFFLELLGFK